jgi:glycosyltransferase involved in cell wall biosynthesis
MPSVSVIIPTIDGAERTRQAVRSVLQQTTPAKEVIVVDDGSPYPFTEKALGDGDPRVRVIRLPSNRGAAAARQIGAEAARGEFLAFLDADDTWFSQKLQRQLALLDNNRDVGSLTAVTCGWVTTLKSRGRQRARIPRPSASAVDFLSGCWFSPGSTLVLSREAFFQVGPFDDRLLRLEDFEWGIRFGLAGGCLLVEPTIGARIQPSGRARFSQVAAASRLIDERYASDPRVRLRGRRRLLAYLALERASAAWAEGAYPLSLFDLGRSFLLQPRASFPLRRWWIQQFNS